MVYRGKSNLCYTTVSVPSLFMTEFLNAFPMNGSKTYVGIVAAAILIGLTQLGYLHADLSNRLLEWVSLWTGMSLAHKIAKIEPASA